MAVNLIDPNAVNNSNIINGSPQYENMHIFAKLTAVGRDRTIITINGNSENIVTEQGKTGGVNFLGANTEYSFTTDWYDGSTANNNQEAFGITSIKTIVNSSFIPQVNIKFVDIRGLSFFYNNDSPYRMMFDFPPPIFNLTIKGYYGKALTYQLHLVKYISDFQSDTGNFIIDADFVAMTYAPLTDVLLQYTAHFPMMNTDAVLNGDVSKPPINTLDLIEKTKRLYSKLPEKVKSSAENIDFTTASSKLDACYEANEFLTNYITDDILISCGVPKLYIYKESNPVSIIKTLIPVNKINDFNKYSTVDSQFLIGYETGSSGGTTNFNTPNYVNYKNNTYAMKNALIAYGDKLSKTIDSSNSNLTGVPVVLQAQSIEYPNTPKIVEFACLDITNAYKQLTSNFSVNRNKKEQAKTALNKSINNIVYSFLGMEPTIYNIFEIILNDVDIFFNEIRKTSYKAQGIYSGTDAINMISGHAAISNREKNGKIIYPFPQIIKNNERATPQMFEGMSNIEFPELDLINRYISTYLKVKKQMKKMISKEEISADGNNTWIPFTSADSSLPTNSSSDNPYATTNMDSLFAILLKRYYVLAQNVMKNEMLSDPKYVDLYAKSEAINACDAITDALFTSQMQTASGNYSVNIDNFFDKISKTTELYNLFALTQNYEGLNDIMLNGHHYVISRLMDDVYDGFEIIDNNASLDQRKETANGNDPITLFIKDAETQIWKRVWKSKSKTESGKYIYTTSNLLLVKDTNGNSVDETKFIKSSDTTTEFLTISDDTLNNNIIDILLTQGNTYYGNSSISRNKAESLNIHTDFYRTWANALTENGDMIISNANISIDVKGLIYLSNFGNTCGMFNRYRNYLNDYLFNKSSIIEMPKFVSAYIGAILTVAQSQSLIDELKGLYTNQTMLGNLIFADIHDCVKFLSKLSKAKFLLKYSDFRDANFIQLNQTMMDIVSYISTQNIENSYDKNSAYYIKLTSDKGKFACLMDREYFLNFNEITFKLSDFNTDQSTYKSLSLLRANSDTSQMVNSFFKTFFIKMADILISRKKEIMSEDAQFKSMTNDTDIVNQMYYSFKNINDKWISGLPMRLDGGYPFNYNSGKLIDMFAFVDRNMSPIGDTIINPQALADLYDNDESTIFTVISTLLSKNGFEFFPLQNFMVSNDKTNWEDCFKISNNTIKPSSPTYVCMYVGGSSNYLTNNSYYANDGIDDMEKDFYPSSNLNLTSYPNNLMMERNGAIQWNHVNGFKVRFGAQNQSMFKDIKIESKEFPETNESLQILSKLAGDNTKIAPVPKSQNLYNLYENRAYKATISGLGNVMIQPTQYFQLENVPMYNGVYLILGVEHNITENGMITEFHGTKILKYPIPRVTQSSTAFGYGGGDSDETAVGLGRDNMSGNGTLAANNSDLLSGVNNNYQSLYTFKIGNGYVPLMSKGEAYIRKICAQHGNSSFTGTGNPLYVGDPHPNITWVANPSYTKRNYDANGNVESSSIIALTTGNLADALISMYNYYAKQYDLDANVIAAQQFRESAYKLWVYNTYEGDLNAMGLPQFLRSTVSEIIINNSYNIFPKFSDAEIAKITNGLSNPHNLYAVNEDKRVILQNIMNNPEIMIKAQCRYMKAISEKCNNLTSSTIFSYYLGPAVSAPTYADTTRKAQSIASVKKDNIPKAISYVASIFRDLNNNFFESNILKLNDIADAHQSNQA